MEENATSVSSLLAGVEPIHQMIGTDSGLGMIFSSISLTAQRGVGANENTILASFPPIVVKYRLAGVDGEAKEDKVEVDPEAPKSNSCPSALERHMEKEFDTMHMVTRDVSVAVLLASAGYYFGIVAEDL